jgi:glycosyltransferase involved in cell wall biosynthesis
MAGNGTGPDDDSDRQVLIDATPLQNEHRRRGIGRYVVSIVGALVSARVSGWGLLAYPDRQLTQAAFRVSALTPRRLEFHGGWLANEILIPLILRRARVRSFHATDPRAVPDPRVVREVVTVYDLTPLRDPAVWQAMWPDQRLGFRRMLSNARHAPVIIAISSAVKTDLIEHLGIDPSKIHVVYPAIDVDRWASADAPARRSGILFVGAPDPHKNIGLVLDALARIDRGGRPALTIVGPWDATSIVRVAAMAESLGVPAPEFEPMIADDRLGELYRSAAALVMPSRREGFGLPVLEAMAAGCPVIASDIPSLVEVTGDAGVLLPLDAGRWADAISSVARDEATVTRLAEAGHRRALEFSPARTVDQLRSAYRALGAELGPGLAPS